MSLRISRQRRFGAVFVPLLVLALAFGVFFMPHSAKAANEVFTWKDYRTITVSGPDLGKPSDLLMDLNANPTGDMSAIFHGTLYYNSGYGFVCTVNISLYTFHSNGDGGGRAWDPPPYGGVSVVPAGAPISCYSLGQSGIKSSQNNPANNQRLMGLDAAIHDQWEVIGGTRPPDPNPPERPEEQVFGVTVNSSDPQTVTPATDTIYLYSGDGKTLVQTLVVPFTSQTTVNGVATWPPAQTPVAASATFQGVLPGDYIACDSYVAKNCTDPTKLIPGQAFTKVKYNKQPAATSTSYGTLYLTPEKRRINVQVNDFIYNVPCGSSVTAFPITVELTAPDGKVTDQQTNSNTAVSPPSQNGALCTQTVSVGLQTVFENMAPGDYKLCATGAACVTVTKPVDDSVDAVLNVNELPQTGPPDQQVCSSGDGIAGALVWIICPAVELVAKASNFLETNIIVPFLTVSPLTTSAQNPAYIIWQDIRDFANVAFVIFVFISIFSITLSKYNLKQVLPKLLIVAIGINLSYFGVALVIDTFNILGGGLSQLVVVALQQAGTTQLTDGTTAGPVHSIFALGGTALLAILLTGGAALGWLVSFILFAALVIVVVVLILIVRQAAIVLLVILSPVAILFYMLPNTESYFKKWRQTLLKLLIMYPMIVLLFASGKIFGIILQQPGFKIGGDGVTDQVGQAVRVILQFLVYIIPLVFLPATFAASGFALDKGTKWANRRILQPRTKKLGENAKQLAGESKLRIAQKTGISFGMKRNYTRQSRRQNLEREQQEYLASALENSKGLRRRAAGVSGQSGQTRAAAYAADVASKARTQDLESEMALLNDEMRNLGVDQKTFAHAAGEYLADPSDVSKQSITGSNGRTFNFNDNAPRFQRALLNSAASQGEITAIEAARMSKTVDQTMLDDIIRRNDGALKSTGGYHLATNFKLGNGRMQVRDPASGALRAPVNDEEVRTEMVAQRLMAMSQTGADSIAGMKSGLTDSSATILRTPGAFRDSVLQAMDAHAAAETATRRASNPTASPVDYRASLRTQMDQVLNPRNKETLARSDTPESDFRDIRNNI